MAYNVQSAVDGKNDLIVEYAVSMNPSDQHQLGIMAKKVKRQLKLKRFIVLADKGYYNGEGLLRVKRYKVTAIVSKQKSSDPKDQPTRFHTDKFTYNPATDTYNCPKGNTLYAHNKKEAKRRNFFNKTACSRMPPQKRVH